MRVFDAVFLWILIATEPSIKPEFIWGTRRTPNSNHVSDSYQGERVWPKEGRHIDSRKLGEDVCNLKVIWVIISNPGVEGVSSVYHSYLKNSLKQQWFSKSAARQSHPEGLLNHRSMGPIPRVSGSEDLELKNLHFLHLMLMLQTQAPLLENHWFRRWTPQFGFKYQLCHLLAVGL